jgi:protease IV
MMPGPRPPWITVELTGTYPALARRTRLLGIPLPPELGLTETSMEELSQALAGAGRASWLKGVFFRFGSLRVGQATAYSLRTLVHSLRQAGKKTVAYVPTLDWQNLYIASAAERVICPESADVRVLGLGLSVTFYRDTLAKIGVSFEKLAIGEYKNAFDELARSEMTPAQREQYEALLESTSNHVLGEVARSRGKSLDEVRGFVDEGVTSAKRSMELGMIDEIAYERDIAPRDTKPIETAARFFPPPPHFERGISIVPLFGAIVPGRSKRPAVPIPGAGRQMSGADTIIRALRSAESDPAAAAIVLYVDSGGGSALASDLIGCEVARIKHKKPVIAVMGAAAASGGYYVLTHATRVIAAPTTITGSIGVLTGKIVFKDLLSKIDAHATAIQRGRFARLTDPSEPFGDADRDLLRRTNDECYDRFTRRVSEGRNIPLERVREIARGRVYTGADAKELGLVDELGDLSSGIAVACDLGGLPRDAPAYLANTRGPWIVPSPDDPTTLVRALAELRGELNLLWWPTSASWTTG